MKVLYQAACYAPNTTAQLVLPIAKGASFDLALVTQDLRPPGTYDFMGSTRNLMRGVFAAYCNILFDKTMARVQVAEVQTLTFHKTQGTFRLVFTQPNKPNKLPKSTSTLAYNNATQASVVLTATQIARALNTLFGGNVVTVVPWYTPYTYFGGYNIRFTGAYDVDEPLLNSSTADVVVSELVKGDPNFAPSFLGSFMFGPKYPNGRQAVNTPQGIGRLGAFNDLSGGSGVCSVEVVWVRMLALQAGTVAFKPDLAGLAYPNDDCLVYGNWAATPPEYSNVDPSEVQLTPFPLTIQ